ELVPAAPGRAAAGAGMGDDRPGLPGRRGAARPAGALGPQAGRAAAGGLCAGPRDRRQHRPGVGRAQPADDLEDAGCRPSDGGTQGGFQGYLRARQVGRREGGGDRLPGEAAGEIPHESQRRNAILFSVVDGAQVPVKGIQEEPMSKIYLPRRAVLAAVPALVAAPYIAHAQGKPEKTKVVLAVGGKSALYYLPLTIAERKGFFKDAGLTSGAYEHTLRMQQRGQAIKGFVLMGRGMQIAIGLRKEVAAKVKGPADIKGMKFGVRAPGSSTHMLLLRRAATRRPT